MGEPLHKVFMGDILVPVMSNGVLDQPVRRLGEGTQGWLVVRHLDSWLGVVSGGCFATGRVWMKLGTKLLTSVILRTSLEEHLPEISLLMPFNLQPSSRYPSSAAPMKPRAHKSYHMHA